MARFIAKDNAVPGVKGACYKCKRVGHFKAQCPVYQGWNKNGQGGGSNKELVMVTKCNFSSLMADGWWIDSGATKNIARTRQGLVESRPVGHKESRVYMGNGAYTEVRAIGTYKLNVGMYNILLMDVLYAPGMRRTLFSVPMLIKKGYDVRFYQQQSPYCDDWEAW